MTTGRINQVGQPLLRIGPSHPKATRTSYTSVVNMTRQTEATASNSEHDRRPAVETPTKHKARLYNVPEMPLDPPSVRYHAQSRLNSRSPKTDPRARSSPSARHHRITQKRSTRLRVRRREHCSAGTVIPYGSTHSRRR